MDIGLLNILRTVEWDFRRDMAQSYANALKNAIELHVPNDAERTEGFFLSKKGYQKDNAIVGANFEDKLYVGNIHRIENHLYYNDEELADDDQIINVVVVDGPVTRDGGACSYGTKDFRDQVQYANMIPQVVGHLFIVNTPGGESACRNDYDEMFNSCRQAGKWTVGYVDGICCSSGVNMLCRADRVVVRNPKDDFGCIGSMAAFWATPDGAVDRDGTRFIEIVGDASPEKNDWYREAAQGDYEKLREMINKDTEEFHQTVRENRPLVKDWMLTGKVFEAQELIPALVDEIGTFDRAIECVFELANGTLPAARTMIPDGETAGDGNGAGNGDEPEEKAINPKNDNDMNQEEMKAAELAEQPTATQEAPSNSPEGGEQPATEQPAEEAPAVEEPETPAQEENETPAEETPATEEEKPAEEEAPTEEETPAEEPAPSNSPEGGEQETEGTEELGKMQETLQHAEEMIALKDKTIEELNAEIAEKAATIDRCDKQIAEQDAALVDKDTQIESLNMQVSALTKEMADKEESIKALLKQNADLKAEVKELAGKPAPMVNAESGIPADNGTGEAPKQPKQCRVKRGMSYQEIRKAMAEEK